MARHALSRSRRRALLRAGLTVTAVGAALGAGGAAAQAAPLPVAPASGADSSLDAVGGATGAFGHAVSPLTQLQLDPLANTGVDPLANGVGTQVADFKPVSTGVVTDPLTSGGALKDLPVVGQVAGLLHG
ncbi:MULTISPECIES: hypothetical protein [Streptomyces]|jgi:hypothetical protein|uniref:hypothetical protein n=1 Tax=unclassified Streptomyces TaxID=2593676 RepID=UPI0004CB2572|nr:MULTISPECIES: hypothetical protein [unclassified Streptomyces]MDX2727529.1 hypothetical protein [Streptomyces sp. PA03-2a]MDX3764978.1 hypothetical protein [Streptomyces sp. AK08-01B]MDX3814557.1 hypothetical protein [Streptomyces sp. AK08-01A]WSQ27762.1 hypothetical protein OG763_19155 [Streptomyces sp. NBC_01230]SCY59773.1 hypothetical protein SAMN02745898_102646 [Streptomyces sp. 136MFCol5.1]